MSSTENNADNHPVTTTKAEKDPIVKKNISQPANKKTMEYNKNFICPITQEPMIDPVIIANGHSYEREAIQEWLADHNTCPKTNLVLEHKELISNKTLKAAIHEMLESCKLDYYYKNKKSAAAAAAAVPSAKAADAEEAEMVMGGKAAAAAAPLVAAAAEAAEAVETAFYDQAVDEDEFEKIRAAELAAESAADKAQEDFAHRCFHGWKLFRRLQIAAAKENHDEFDLNEEEMTWLISIGKAKKIDDYPHPGFPGLLYRLEGSGHSHGVRYADEDLVYRDSGKFFEFWDTVTLTAYLVAQD